MQPITQSKAYLKEYSTYHFTAPSHPQPPLAYQYYILFHPHNQKTNPLPSVLIDQFDNHPTLYVLNWKPSQQREQLYIKTLDATKWIQITLNLKPNFIHIFSAQIFFISGKELCIINLANQQQHFVNIQQYHQISHVFSTVVSYQTNKGEVCGQSGIGIIFKDQKNYYNTKTYSINKKHTEKSLLNALKLMPKFQQESMKLQLIIPNHIGLVLNSDHQFSIYNLQQMKVEQSTATSFLISKIKANDSVLVRWKEHNVQKGYNLTFIVVIAIGQHIELFFLSFKYRPEILQKYNNFSLQKIYNQSIIDWTDISITPYQVLSIDGRFLVDMVISQSGIVYLSKQKKNDEIGVWKFIDISTSLIEYQIISSQASIWRRQKQQSQTNQEIKHHRYFLPNRYPLQLIHNEQKMRQDVQSIDSKDIFYKWLKDHKFKQFIIFQEEILVIRGQSIGVLREIKEQLFDFQYFSEENLQKLCQKQQRMADNKLLHKNLSYNYEQSLIHGQSDSQIYKQRRYLKKEDNEHDIQQMIQNEYNEYFHLIKQHIKKVLQREQVERNAIIKIKSFQFKLFTNMFYDRLNYYQLIINRTVFRIHSVQEETQQTIQRQTNKEYEYNIFFVKLINYYYHLTQHSYPYYRHYQTSLLQAFIQENNHLIDGDIDGSIDSVLRLLLENLVPICISNYKNSLIYVEDMPYNQYIQQNKFIQFIIKELLQEYERNKFYSSEKQSLLRSELSNIIKIGFLQCRSIYFTKFQRNKSLFKALILCNDTQLIQQYFTLFIIKSNLSHFINEYITLKLYISKESVQCIENILFYTYSFHNIPVDIRSASKGKHITHTQFVNKQGQSQQQSRITYQRLIFHNMDINKIQSFCLDKIQSLFLKIYGGQLQIDDFLFDFDLYFQKYMAYLSNQLQDKKFQLFQKMIEKFIGLFNSKITKKYSGDTIGQDIREQELLKDKWQLKKIYQRIQHYYQSFIAFQLQLNGQSNSQNTQESLLLKQMRFFQAQTGIKCNRLGLNLIKDALYSSDDSDILLLNKQNLMILWLKEIKAQSNNQTKLSILEAIYAYGKRQIKEILIKYDQIINLKTELSTLLSQRKDDLSENCLSELYVFLSHTAK